MTDTLTSPFAELLASLADLSDVDLDQISIAVDTPEIGHEARAFQAYTFRLLSQERRRRTTGEIQELPLYLGNWTAKEVGDGALAAMTVNTHAMTPQAARVVTILRELLVAETIVRCRAIPDGRRDNG